MDRTSQAYSIRSYARHQAANSCLLLAAAPFAEMADGHARLSNIYMSWLIAVLLGSLECWSWSATACTSRLKSALQNDRRGTRRQAATVLRVSWSPCPRVTADPKTHPRSNRCCESRRGVRFLIFGPQPSCNSLLDVFQGFLFILALRDATWQGWALDH